MKTLLNRETLEENLALIEDELDNAIANKLSREEIEEMTANAVSYRNQLGTLDTVPNIEVDGVRFKQAGSAEFNDAMKTEQEAQTPEMADAARAISAATEQNAIAKRLETGEEQDIAPEHLPLLGQGKADGTGDFVFALQGNTGTGTDEKFAHVHRDWVSEGCMSYEDGLSVLADQQSMIEDFHVSLSTIKPAINPAGEFCFEFEDGRQYVPTPHALKNLANMSMGSEWFLNDLVTPKLARVKNKNTGEKDVIYERDIRDFELVKRILEDTVFRADRVDQEKVRLFRTWKDGTMRAVLSEQYAIVNNQWLVEVLKELIPGGLLSHWRGDADTIFGNILIPDTIRKESDSEYGGMLSIGNSEIGVRRISTCPSVFRSICMNGCIWGGETGVAMNKRHRGTIDLDLLKLSIKQNLDAQIPLLSEGIDMMLKQREFVCQAAGVDVSMRNVFAEMASKLKLSRSEATGVFDSWHVERKLLGSEIARSAFGVQAAVTRYGQTIKRRDGKADNDAWLKFDTLGGDVANLTDVEFAKLVDRASKLDEKTIEKAFVKVEEKDDK